MKHELIRKAFERELKEIPKKKAVQTGRRKNRKPVHETGAGLHNKYLTYEQAKIFCAKAKYITSAPEYKEWVKIKGYKFLPLTPTYIYRREWEGWVEYLGTDRRPRMRKILPYYEAKSIAHKLALKFDLTSGDCFQNWLKFWDDQYLLEPEDRDLPNAIPRQAHNYYHEWEGYPTFLGKGLKSKLEEVQEKAKITKEAQNEKIVKYNGQAVYALTSGIDPMNPNMIKVIVDYTGLSQLLATCDNLQYDILSIYIFNKDQLGMILDNLNMYGSDHGDSCFMVNDLNALLSSLEFDTVKLPEDLYK